MTISYQNTRADFVALLDHLLQTRYGRACWLLRRALPAVLVLLVFVLVAIIWRYGALLPARLKTMGLAYAVLCLGFSQGWPIYYALNFWFARRAGFGAPVTIELHDRGVRICYQKGESLIYWATFPRIDHGSERLFLFLTARSAVVIPDSAFSSPTEAEIFTHFAQTHWELAKNDTVPPIASPCSGEGSKHDAIFH